MQMKKKVPDLSKADQREDKREGGDFDQRFAAEI